MELAHNPAQGASTSTPTRAEYIGWRAVSLTRHLHQLDTLVVSVLTQWGQSADTVACQAVFQRWVTAAPNRYHCYFHYRSERMQNVVRAFIVDDDAQIRELLSAYLISFGIQGDGVGDGEAMRHALAEQHYDIIILDLMLPGDDGLVLCRELRASSAILIIMLTKSAERSVMSDTKKNSKQFTRHQAIEAGFLDTIGVGALISCGGGGGDSSSGQVTFTTIYPGWYAGRITHIHLRAYMGNNLEAPRN